MARRMGGHWLTGQQSARESLTGGRGRPGRGRRTARRALAGAVATLALVVGGIAGSPVAHAATESPAQAMCNGVPWQQPLPPVSPGDTVRIEVFDYTQVSGVQCESGISTTDSNNNISGNFDVTVPAGGTALPWIAGTTYVLPGTYLFTVRANAAPGYYMIDLFNSPVNISQTVTILVVPPSTPACSVTPVTSGSVTTYTFTNTTACQWTAPDPTGKTVTVTVVGGGGGGGGGFYNVTANDPFGGGGGGGGEVKSQVPITLPTGTLVTVTAGDGGSAGGGGQTSGSAATDGGNGSASSFTDGSSINVTAAGGSGGKQGLSTIGGNGGASGTSKAGGAGRALAYGGGGGGGGGSTADGLQSNNGANGGNGGGGSTVSGVGYGGGGGGGALYNSSANRGLGFDGGGNGGDERPAEAGTANRGGGGGGGVGVNNLTNPPVPGAGGAGGSGVIIVTYTAMVSPTFVNASPPTSGTVNTAYAGFTFTANGTAPITFTKDSGDLPPGLTLATNGVLSGTPTTAGSYTFKVKAANGVGSGAVTSDITISIAPVPVAPSLIDDTPPTSGTVGTPYAGYTFTAAGTAPITFTRDSGNLPPGLTLASNGLLSGTPTAAGTYTFKVRAANGVGSGAVTSDITISIAPPAPAPVPASPPELVPGSQSLTGKVGSAVSPTAALRLVNFTLPARFSIYPVLPQGLVLDPVTGVVSGTPTATHASTRHWITASAGGGSESAVSVLQLSVTEDPTPNPSPSPTPVPVPSPLPPGGSLLLVDGAPAPVTVDPKSDDNGLKITGDGWGMDLDGLGPEGKPLNLGPAGVLILQSEREVQTSGTGFKADSDVDLFLDPPVAAPRTSAAATWLQRLSLRASNGTYVGTVKVDANGSFRGTVTLPSDIAVGDHVLQAMGLSPSGQTRALNLGVRVEPSLVLNTGSRKPAGMHDRIRTTGTSTGIPEGVKLTPHIKYSGQESFSNGKATIVVQSDGSFTWTRLIRKNRAVTAYVSYKDTNSNQVVWVKVR